MACPKGNPKISLGVLTPYVTIINFITTRWLVPKGASARLPALEILAWLRLCWRRANRSIRWTFGKNNDLHYCHQVVKVINRIHQVDEHGETALIIASCLGKTEVLSLVCGQNANRTKCQPDIMPTKGWYFVRTYFCGWHFVRPNFLVGILHFVRTISKCFGILSESLKSPSPPNVSEVCGGEGC